MKGFHLFSGSYENIIQVWDLKKSECIRELSEHRGAIYTICEEDNYFFSGSYDNSVKVWNLDSLDRSIQTLIGHTSKVEAIRVSGGVIYSASSDNTIRVWK